MSVSSGTTCIKIEQKVFIHSWMLPLYQKPPSQNEGEEDSEISHNFKEIKKFRAGRVQST